MTGFEIKAGLFAALLVGMASHGAFAQQPPPAVGGMENAAPTPTEPAETETPQAPAASGGQASDATPSGAPESSAPFAPGVPATTSEPPAAGPPRNAVGDRLELPRLSDRAQQVGLISDLCGVQLKDMPKAACDCLAEKSMTSLADPQRDYLIASVVAPPVAERMLKDGRVGQPDQAAIFAFLERESTACKTGGAPAPN